MVNTIAANANDQMLFIVKLGVKKAVIASIMAEAINLLIICHAVEDPLALSL
jgi:hypothetical protein